MHRTSMSAAELAAESARLNARNWKSVRAGIPADHPRNDDVTMDDVAKSVHDLSEAVTEMREGLVDEAKVRAIAAELLDKQRQVDTPERREGFRPDDLEDGDETAHALRGMTPQQRAAHLHQRSARDGARLVRGVSEEDVRAFHQRADNLVLLSTILGVEPRETRYFQEEYLPSLRAMDTQTATEGAEFVPRDLSSELIERVNLPLIVPSLFGVVNMPTPTFDIPARGVGRVRGGTLAEATADTGQTKAKKITPATRKVTLTAVKFAVEALVSKEETEDSIIPILPFIIEEIVDYMSADREDAIINGDTTGTHQDSDTTSADDPRKAWKGLRKWVPAGARVDAGGDALTTADLLAGRKKMGKYGARPSDLVHIVPMAGYVNLLADTNVQTVDKYGQNATVLTGELGRAHGVPVVVSEYSRQDLNASGVYDGTTTTRHSAQTVFTRAFVRGVRRNMTTQLLTELYSESDQDAIIATLREAFTSRFPSTETVIAEVYNALS
ncbi:MAG TPA: phage major capsid protein [Solirubrobacter sp.]|nr:phage major capsid protein [Solirubrobacter sp.]